MAEVECVLQAKCSLGEGPAWHAKESALYFVDAPGKRIHRWHPASGEHRTFDTPELATAVIPRNNGGLLVVLGSRLAFFDMATGVFTPFVAPEADLPKNRSNDAKCDSRGRLWYGTMQNNFAPDMSEAPITGSAGWLYRISGDGSVKRMDGPFGISNTFAWSFDDRTMYFGDTLKNTIYAYDFEAEAGEISNRRDFASVEEMGFGDGSAIDRQGFLWNARWDGGCVIRFAPDGTVDRVVKMPCRRVTSCAFGGDDLSTLYVTSVRYGLTEAELADEPLAGSVFAIDAGVKGLPVGTFSG
jgi:sugar lactone lactonase YvrE